MSQEKILVVDDESEISEIIKDYLKAEDFQVVLAFDGEQALHKYEEFQPDLMILDIALPKMDGMEVCRIVRAQSAIPILMLSAKKSDIDKILALGLGADDYITKPFSPGELVARVKAQLRRYTRLSLNVPHSKTLKYGDMEIDQRAYTVTVSGCQVPLSVKEFEILSFLAMHPLQVFTREQIFNHIWGFDTYGDINTVTVYIKKIREKIEADPAVPKYIKTVWGVGYKFEGIKHENQY